MLGMIGTIISFLTLLVLYGSLVAIALVLRKISRDVTDLKRSITDLQEMFMLLPKPETVRRSELEWPGCFRQLPESKGPRVDAGPS